MSVPSVDHDIDVLEAFVEHEAPGPQWAEAIHILAREARSARQMARESALREVTLEREANRLMLAKISAEASLSASMSALQLIATVADGVRQAVHNGESTKEADHPWPGTATTPPNAPSPGSTLKQEG